MKRVILITVLILAAIGAGLVWMKKHGGGPAGEKAADAKPPEEKPEETHITRDAEGRAVVNMDDETQGNIGLLVANPATAQLNPELKGYGRVLDPAALAALVTELESGQAAYSASSNEIVRLKTLAGQGNASERALQTAEAAARRDQLAVQSAKDRLTLSWSKAVPAQNDLPAFVQSLTSLNAVLIRIDLPASETLQSPPDGARIVTLSGSSGEAEFLGAASNVDPLNQGRGLIFLVKTNAAQLLPGEAITGYLKLPGNPLSGIIIPREAVIRTEGATWVYTLNEGGEAFTRRPIVLDHPTESGWFLTTGLASTNYVVVVGAQILLSEELKASIKAD